MNYSKSPQRLHLFLIVIPGHQCFVSLADTYQQVLHKIWSFEKECIKTMMIIVSGRGEMTEIEETPGPQRPGWRRSRGGKRPETRREDKSVGLGQPWRSVILSASRIDNFWLNLTQTHFNHSLPDLRLTFTWPSHDLCLAFMFPLIP